MKPITVIFVSVIVSLFVAFGVTQFGAKPQQAVSPEEFSKLQQALVELTKNKVK